MKTTPVLMWTVLGSILASLALITTGCGKDHTPGGGGAESSERARSQRGNSFDHRVSFPLLSAQETAQKIAADSVLKSDSSAAAVQFAQSVEANARTAEVIGAVRDRIRQFDDLEDAKKVLILVLGAENLSVADTDDYSNALIQALSSNAEAVQISALGVLTRHPNLSGASGTAAAFEHLVLKSSGAGVLVRHWIAVAVNALALASTTDFAERIFAQGIANPDLEIDTVLRGVPPSRLQSIFHSHLELFSAERSALVASRLPGRRSS